MKKRILTVAFAAVFASGAFCQTAPAESADVSHPDDQKSFEGLFPPDVKTIGIVSVSDVIPRKSFDRGTNLLAAAGYRVKVMPNVLKKEAPEVRAKFFEQAWLDPEIDLLLFSRGGRGAAEVIGLVDWPRLRRRNIRVLGFSDVTLVLGAMLAKGAGTPVSGPMLSTLSTYCSKESRERLRAVLDGQPEPVKLDVVKGCGAAVGGKPFAGIIARFPVLLEQGLLPSFDGRVVFIESTPRYADAAEGVLDALAEKGVFAKAAAVVFCDFNRKWESARVREVFVRFAAKVPCPVFAGYPYGHVSRSFALDFTRAVRLSPDGVMTWDRLRPAAPLKMRNIAHRGMWDPQMPQNTVEAIRRAYDAGATWVETDFYHTKAGQMVCIHGPRELKMYTGCDKKIADLTPDDVATLNLGAAASLPHVYRIPLLDQVLAVVPRHAVLQAEIKGYSPQYADIFDAAVKAAGLTERNIVVSSFDFSALKDFKARYPQYRTAWLTVLKKDKPFRVQNFIGSCKTAGIEVFCPGCASTIGVMTPADADAVRAAGLEFRLFGVNSIDGLRRAKELGAAGFTCNFWKQAFSWADEIGGVELLK